MTALTSRESIAAQQLEKLGRMLTAVLQSNEFYRQKLLHNGFANVGSLEEFKNFPFTTKSELAQDQSAHPPYGSNLTFPLERYIRIHQTSGTTGKPLYWLDTEEAWQWWAECWEAIFRAAGVHPGDRVYFAFSFGPFIGFWSGWEGARKVGALAISGGGQSTIQRINAILDYRATVVVCTPTYALHMAAEARKAAIEIGSQPPVTTPISANSTPRATQARW